MTSTLPICLIEDDLLMGESLSDRFALEGFRLDWYRDAASGERALCSKRYAVVISDLRLPDQHGADLYRHLLGKLPALPPFIFITGYGTIDSAVDLLKLGACDYITKPFDLDALVERVRRLCQATVAPPSQLGRSPAMLDIAAQLPRLATHASSVLITGESGAGKERVAREFHALLPGPGQRPFVAVNCAAIPENLLESECFGYEKGAFTGALRAKRGYFEQAHGGTLFLDEIGDMPLSMQSKLLRVLQEREIYRLGAERPLAVDFRLVLATHRDLRQLVQQGIFREDLYYRIHVIHLRIPPLRERPDDILFFAERFLHDFRQRHPEERRHLTPLAEQALLDYPWPGNLRELRNCIERACITANSPAILPEHCFEPAVNPHVLDHATRGNLSEYLAACERHYIANALSRHGGMIGRTAESLGISRKNLWEKMKKYGLSAAENATGPQDAGP